MLFGKRKPTTLKELLPPEVLQRVEEAVKERKGLQDQVRRFQYFVVQVNDQNPHIVPSLMTRVIDACQTEDVVFSEFSFTLFLGYLGLLGSGQDSHEARKRIVAKILRTNGTGVRVVHGEAEGPSGTLGSGERWTYGAVIPQFGEVLSRLLKTEFGTALELPEESNETRQ